MVINSKERWELWASSEATLMQTTGTWNRRSLSHVQLLVTPWTIAHQAPLSMGFSKQEYWSVLPFPSPEDLPNPRTEPRSPALQADSLLPKPPDNGNSLLLGMEMPLIHKDSCGGTGWVHKVGHEMLIDGWLRPGCPVGNPSLHTSWGRACWWQMLSLWVWMVPREKLEEDWVEI